MQKKLRNTVELCKLETNGKEEVPILVRGIYSRMQQLSLGEKGCPCFLLNGCPREGFHYNYKTRVKGTLCHLFKENPRVQIRVNFYLEVYKLSKPEVDSLFRE